MLSRIKQLIHALQEDYETAKAQRTLAINIVDKILENLTDLDWRYHKHAGYFYANLSEMFEEPYMNMWLIIKLDKESGGVLGRYEGDRVILYLFDSLIKSISKYKTTQEVREDLMDFNPMSQYADRPSLSLEAKGKLSELLNSSKVRGTLTHEIIHALDDDRIGFEGKGIVRDSYYKSPAEINAIVQQGLARLDRDIDNRRISREMIDLYLKGKDSSREMESLLNMIKFGLYDLLDEEGRKRYAKKAYDYLKNKMRELENEEN